MDKPDLKSWTPEWPIVLAFDYDEYQPACRDCPESDASATLTSVTLFGIDITEAATKDAAWVKEREEEYLETRAGSYADEQDAKADYLYEQHKDKILEGRNHET